MMRRKKSHSIHDSWKLLPTTEDNSEMFKFRNFKDHIFITILRITSEIECWNEIYNVKAICSVCILPSLLPILQFLSYHQTVWGGSQSCGELCISRPEIDSNVISTLVISAQSSVFDMVATKGSIRKHLKNSCNLTPAFWLAKTAMDEITSVPQLCQSC